ncbi:dihydropteroate synthase [Deinococcus fonticola]|uniref:dihydropteroate synthase n=1 Tax=Deinococcus fonticola TaxID=2528713 RepID=UPI001F116558|nr:dihydropteroate synthase [Deinococcus fonticola]
MRTHRLTFHFPVPGALKTPLGWEVAWTGCRVMGILNATPDSFSDGGKHYALHHALEAAKNMERVGVFMLDIGGESTRPGAEPVDASTELDRVRPVIHALKDARILLSVDTMKPEVAAEALKAGAHLINDVTGLRNPEMVRVCADAGAAACIMHMQGEPRTMQQNPVYTDVVAEVHSYLRGQAARARADGVPSVLLDPGIGFGKTREHNLALLRAVRALAQGDAPVLIAASRKRLIDYLADVPDAADRDPGSLAIHLHAARQGAALVRAHAAGEHVQALRVQAALMAES